MVDFDGRAARGNRFAFAPCLSTRALSPPFYHGCCCAEGVDVELWWGEVEKSGHSAAFLLLPTAVKKRRRVLLVDELLHFFPKLPALLKKKLKAAAAASAAAVASSSSSPSSSPGELAELLLADPVANANLLPKLLALEAVPIDDVSKFFFLCLKLHDGRFFFDGHICRLLPSPSSPSLGPAF